MEIKQNLERWKSSLFPKLELAALISRNPTAHKWKAPFRSMALREGLLWRMHDLLTQSLALYEQGHLLGARILLRSGIETLAILVYLNERTLRVLEGKLDFHEFSKDTATLLLGSRNKTTKYDVTNILTVLDKCEKRHAGIRGVYDMLSESAHPNYEGVLGGYSKIDHENHTTVFSNRWMELHGGMHLRLMKACMDIFEVEYNDVWGTRFDKLEAWAEANDAMLEATKDLTS